MSVVEERSRYFQSKAVTMLTITTGMLGFGSFGAEFCISMDLLHMPLLMIRLGLVVTAVVFYLVLWGSVGVILKSSEVTGEDVAGKPLICAVWVTLCVIIIFMLDNIDGPACCL